MQDHYIRVQHSVLFRYYVLKMSPKWLCHDTGDLSDYIFRNIKATEMKITLRADTKRRSYLYEGIAIFIHSPDFHYVYNVWICYTPSFTSATEQLLSVVSQICPICMG